MSGGMARALAAAGWVLLLAPAARAADPDVVRGAVERGVAYLKQLQQPGGAFSCSYPTLGSDPSRAAGASAGATALAGLTLVECGVPADDEHVRKAASFVRGAAPQLTMTYSLALSILFLDRLGNPADEELIDSLAVRLLAGQNLTNGGWTYNCPPLSDAEVRRLRALTEQQGDSPSRSERPRTPKGEREVKDLPQEIQRQLGQVDRGMGGNAPYGQQTDNSNTQFAILALWVARRQGIPVDAALKRIDRRFRDQQERDGGWGYQQFMSPTGAAAMPGAAGMPSAMQSSTPSMTCAGLLGLALSHGDALEATRRRGARGAAGAPPSTSLDPAKDPAVRIGLLALGSAIGRPLDAVPDRMVGIPRLAPDLNGRGYYFLWSMERVAVAYGLDTIGKKDWYGWGAEVLLRNQHGDGSWQGQYAAGGCDTCFALLFLRRANLAPDLTAILRGRVADPGERELRAGGVGGEGLMKGVGLKPAFETGEGAGRAPASREGHPARPKGGDQVDAQAARLAAELVGAEGEKQAEVLGRLRDSKGGAYSEALALAIPKLTGEARSRARDALADRLTRMTAATLADKLADDDPEVRRAAALASAMKEERSHIPRLIELLNDPEPPVAHAAHAALKSLAGQDLGPEPDATRADVAQAVLRWKEWWRQHGK